MSTTEPNAVREWEDNREVYKDQTVHSIYKRGNANVTQMWPSCGNKHKLNRRRIGYLCNDTSDIMEENMDQWGTMKVLGRPEAPKHRLDRSLLCTFSLGKKGRARITNGYIPYVCICASRSVIAETILEPAVLDFSKALSELLPGALSIFMCVICESNMA